MLCGIAVSPGAAIRSVLGAISVIGETSAEVYQRYANELVHFATGLVGPDDAQDVVMEAMARAFSSARWPQVEERRAYLYRCVLNHARSHHRSTLARRVRERRAAEPLQVAPPLPDPDVLAAVGQLSMRQRAVVVLTYWEDRAVAEVASTLGISEGSVRRHLARARARLREALA
jgi:RNA polymerase sigma factor (sigma-70 family)